jgi:hypothetical protein
MPRIKVSHANDVGRDMHATLRRNEWHAKNAVILLLRVAFQNLTTGRRSQCHKLATRLRQRKTIN